jgi:hypothetical protein
MINIDFMAGMNTEKKERERHAIWVSWVIDRAARRTLSSR